jgi:tRNA (guanine37-N1)-methyltransferase
MDAMTQRPRNLQDALREHLTPEQLDSLGRAFEVIGDLAIVDVPPELAEKEPVIGDALLRLYKNVKTVLARAPFKGEWRTRDLRVIAGEPRTTTEHKENGIRLRLDAAAVYFSPRFSTERLRVAQLVGPDERVLVLFAGVAPFSVAIAKRDKSVRVKSVEANPACTAWAQENVRINKVAGQVEVIQADAKTYCLRAEMKGWANRVVMPLPEKAIEFLDETLYATAPGGVIHLYGFGSTAKDADTYHELINALNQAAAKQGKRVEILRTGECGTYAPRVNRLVVDARVI